MKALTNKRAKYDYEIKESFEAGIVLDSLEVKAIRAGNVDFNSAYVKILGNEAYVINMHLAYEGIEETRRTRKLLLHKKQIYDIQDKVKRLKLTVIPVKLYNKGRKFKLEIALAKSRKKFSKKELKKSADIERDIEREMKEGTK